VVDIFPPPKLDTPRHVLRFAMYQAAREALATKLRPH
jgi:hypothetical protein